jgi:Region found in RelA / SpoT proteins
MLARLKLHLDYLFWADPHFRLAVRDLNSDAWRRCLRLLCKAEVRRLTLADSGKELQAPPVTAGLAMRQIVEDLSEQGFPDPPAAAGWIASSLNAEGALRSYRRVSARLAKFLYRCSLPALGFYGGVKAEQAILKKIAPFKSNGVELDLWDVVRFRIVTPDLHGLFAVCSQLLGEFDPEVVRCRNYYLRPRDDDEYRAVHFELRDEEDGFVEVQVMTALREAVGMVDHSLVRQRAMPFIDGQHQQWLKDLSRAANTIDSESKCGVGGEGYEPEFIGAAWNRPDFHGGSSGSCPATREPAFQESLDWVQPGDPIPHRSRVAVGGRNPSGRLRAS